MTRMLVHPGHPTERLFIMSRKKKKRTPSPFPRGKPIPPGKSHVTKKDYNRRIRRQLDIREYEEE